MDVISATEARKKFFDILNEVGSGGKEYIIEKKDTGKRFKIVADEPARPSPEEVDKLMADLRKIFAKSRKRKYWSVIETPAWKKKEAKYVEDLSNGIIR